MLTLLPLFAARRLRPARLALLLAALLGLLALAAARPAAASTYLVTSVLDDGSAGSLRDAINAANGNAGSTITFDPAVFPPGTAQPTLIKLTSALPPLSANVTITGPGASVVAVDGQNAVRPFYVSSGVTASLSGLTIQNGKRGGSTFPSDAGGGVYNAGTLTLTGCALTNDFSNSSGGGVENNASTLTLIGCTLTGNTGTYGGGVDNSGGLVTLTGCTLTGNTGTYGGGGVCNGVAGTLSVTGCTFTGNNGDGGGVLNNGTGTLTGCTLTNNSASTGGGVYNFPGRTLTLTGCTLTGNSATAGGGAFNQRGTVTLTDDILYGDGGGEVFNNRGSIAITYSDIQGNGAGGTNIDADPQFFSAPSGGPYDLHLNSNSPCLGSGGLASGATDHDGNPYANPPSMGAFQYGVYTVTNVADSGGGSLRAAITYADANGSANNGGGIVVNFLPGLSGTILLGSALPALSANVTITGPGASVVAVDGAQTYQPFSVNSGVTASLSGLTIQNGNDGGNSGGGVLNNGTLALTNCALLNNMASGIGGGGVYNFGTVTLTDCTLEGNDATAGEGGGVCNESGTMTLTGCTLTGNVANSDGGGGVENDGTITLTNCTLTGNRAVNCDGGAIDTEGSVTLTNDILYGDTATSGTNEVYGSPVTASYCDIGEALGTGGDGVTDNGNNVNQDPGFFSAPSGGPYDQHLNSNSPCIHAGTPVTDGNGNPVTKDHDGNSYADPNPSMGAFQYGVYTVTNVADSGGGSLRAAITYADANGSANNGGGIVVNFLPGLSGTILLASGLPALSTNVTIQGPRALAVAVDGQHAVRPFVVNTGVTASLSRLTIQNGNDGGNNGGGVYNFGNLTLTGCTLTNNSAPGGYGGAVFNATGTATLKGCTLTNNSAPGGGACENNGGATLVLTGCTLTGNGGQFGAIYNVGALTLTDDILYGDTNGEIALFNGTVIATYCDIAGYAAAPDPGGNFGADPLLSALGNYGGPTQTFALLPGSPCFGKGTNAGLTTDQRGVPIPQSGRYDIGAFESRGFALSAPVGGSGQSTPVTQAFGTNLTVTVSSSFGEPVVGGVLAVTAPATTSPSATLTTFTVGTGGAASATATADSLAGGPYTVTASTNAEAGSAASYTLTNLKATPSVGVTSGSNPSTFGDSVTFTATITGAVNPGGSVTFSIDGGTAGAADESSTNFTASGGTATYTTSALSGGPHTVTATYSGDDNNNGKTSPSFTQTVYKVGTGVSLTSSLNPSFTGQAVTFTAMVTGSSPTGTVTFSDGATALGAPVPLTGGTATLTTSSLLAGRHTITARYGGDANNAASSGTLTQTVTNTVVTVSSASGIYGQNVTLSAGLHGVGAIALPGRTLTFSVDGAVVGTAKTDGTSVATLRLALGTAYQPGCHSLTVTFAGDAAGATPFHAASTGTGTLTVSQAGSSLTVPGVPGTRGQAVTLRARLTRTPDHAALSGQSVSFFVDGVFAGCVGTDGTGQAVQSYCVPGSMAPGGHKITVSFSGTWVYGSCSGLGTLTVLTGSGPR